MTTRFRPSIVSKKALLLVMDRLSMSAPAGDQVGYSLLITERPRRCALGAPAWVRAGQPPGSRTARLQYATHYVPTRALSFEG